MLGLFIFVVLLSALGFSLYACIKRGRLGMCDQEWRRVPPPNWRCCRGGREYF